jgi:hypothetical protein
MSENYKDIIITEEVIWKELEVKQRGFGKAN